MSLDPQTTMILTGVAVFAIAALAARLLHSIVHRALDTLDIVSAENRQALKARAQRLTRAVTLLAFLIATLATMSLALGALGIDEPRWSMAAIRHWFLNSGVRIVLIIVIAVVIVRAAHLVIEHLQHKLAGRHAKADLEWQRRSSTLSAILTSLITVSVCFVAILMLLRELTIDVVPILTGAGIAGLAIGFGAQNLVRDVISGFFLILEDQVRIGDLARINGVTGKVEQINLRTIVVRDVEGSVQVFPNGIITTLANLSKQFAFAVVDVRVGYHENLERVFGTIREIGASMERDAAWGPQVLAPIEISGVESLDNGLATIRMRFKTLPLHQGPVASELRRRILGAFVGRGIKPYA